MQGRLVKKFQGRYQAFPINEWEKEFKIASKLNIRNIEFIIDSFYPELNPLVTSEGIIKIKNLEKRFKIKVTSICADYFMDYPIHIQNNKNNYSLNFLVALIKSAKKLNIKNIILPCVDKSSILNRKNYEKNLINNIKSIKKIFEKCKVNICLETDLSPNKIKKIIMEINSIYFGINYDTGNSASLGYSIRDEFNAYGKHIKEIHIKDRLLNGKSVKLGKGNTDFNLFFDELNKINYKGVLIFQPYRDYYGKKIFVEQFKWFKRRMEMYKKNEKLYKSF